MCIRLLETVGLLPLAANAASAQFMTELMVSSAEQAMGKRAKGRRLTGSYPLYQCSRGMMNTQTSSSHHPVSLTPNLYRTAHNRSIKTCVPHHVSVKRYDGRHQRALTARPKDHEGSYSIQSDPRTARFEHNHP